MSLRAVFPILAIFDHSVAHMYTIKLYVAQTGIAIMKVLDHVMPREKRFGALDSCFGLVGPHQQSIRNFSLWHYEFIKAAMSAACISSKLAL